jgi:small ligand-binding sensory domain FIST
MSSPDEILAAHYAANPHVAAQLQTPDKSPSPSVDSSSAGVVGGSSLVHTDGPAVRLYEPAGVGLSTTALSRLTTYTQSVVNDVRVPHGSESVHLCVSCEDGRHPNMVVS